MLEPELAVPSAMAQRWVSLHIDAPEGALRERVVAMLVNGGAGAVQELDSQLLTHLQEGAILDAMCEALERAGATIQRTALGEVDWSARWVTRVGVQRMGRIAVAPPWMSRGDRATPSSDLIEPAMAFGTG